MPRATSPRTSQRQLLRANRALRLLHATQMIVQEAADEQKLLQAICDAVVDTAGYRLAWGGKIKNDENRLQPVAQAGNDVGYVSSLIIIVDESPVGRGPVAEAIRSGRPVAVQNVRTDERFLPWRKAAVERGFKAVAVLPIIVGGAAIGALAIYAGEPDAFDAEELEVLNDLARSAARGIETLRARQAQLRAEEALRANLVQSQLLANVVRKTTNAVLIADLQWNVQWINDAFARMTGYTQEELIGRFGLDILDGPGPTPEQIEAIRRHVQSGERFSADILGIAKDGHQYWYQVNAQPLLDETGARIGHMAIGSDITELKQALQELSAQEQYLRSLVDSQTTYLVRTDLQGNYTFANQAFLQQFGMTSEEVIGSPASMTVIPEDRPILQEMVQRCLAEPGSTQRAVLRKQRQPKDVYWSQWEFMLLVDPDGAPSAIQCVGYNVSDRVAAEEALRHLNETLEQRVNERTQALENEIAIRRQAESELAAQRDFARQITETMGQALLVVDADGTIEYANPEMARLTGLPINAIMGGSLFNHIYAEDRASLEACFTKTPKYAAKTCEIRLQRPSGELRYVLATATPRARRGQAAGWIAVITDLTERRAAEEALRRSEQRYHSVIAALAEGIVIHDATGAIAATNASADRILQLPQPTGNGRPANDSWQAVHEDGSPFPDEEHPAMITLRTGQPQREVVMGLPTINGTTWISINSQPLFYAGSDLPQGAVASFVDITARKEMEEALLLRAKELTILNGELERAARMKDEFMANMSHELRTPLTGILGLAEGMQSGVMGEVNERQLRGLELILESGRHLLNLINDILDLSKVEAGQMTLQVERLIVNDVCEAALRMVRQLAAKKRQSLTYTVLQNPETLHLTMRADTKRLKQILVNLLSNAVKFTPDGGELGLDVRLDQAAGVIRFTVWDHGIGIAPEFQARLFQPFVQLDNSLSRQYLGTGLGLALVRRLADLHGGAVQLESTPGRGSRFTVVLPWNDEPEAARPAVVTSTPTAPADLDARRQAIILIAEDNAVLVMTYTGILKAQGYALVVANNGAEAVIKAREMIPDLILMDIQMPGMDGLEATRRIRSSDDPQISSIPIIALTAHAMRDDRERCLAAGATEYLSKPAPIELLLGTIQRLLQRTS